MSRFKKYTMTPISSKFSEKGGYSARFVGDGYTVDARKEILPGVIKDTGILIGEGAAWDFFRTFLQRCVLRVADTGETVTLDSLLSIGLSIQGWFANKDSKASKENVRVSAKLLKELKPNVVFTMSNENDGFTLLLTTVMSDGWNRHGDRPPQSSEGIFNTEPEYRPVAFCIVHILFPDGSSRLGVYYIKHMEPEIRLPVLGNLP